MLETPLLWGRPSTAGNVSLLPEAPLFFLWGSCFFFFLGRGDPVLLGTGYTSPFTGAPPLCWGCPSAASWAPLLQVEYTLFLFVMGRPSSTGGAHLLLGRLSSAGYCQWGAHILFGGPNLCWRLPISDLLLLWRLSSAGAPPLLLGAPVSCWRPLFSAGAPLFCQWHPFSYYGAPFLLGRPAAVRAPLFSEWGRLSPFAGASLLFRGTRLLLRVPFRCQGRPS